MTNLGVEDWRVGERGKIQVKQVKIRIRAERSVKVIFLKTTSTIILVALTEPYQLHPTTHHPRLLIYNSTNDIHHQWLFHGSLQKLLWCSQPWVSLPPVLVSVLVHYLAPTPKHKASHSLPKCSSFQTRKARPSLNHMLTFLMLVIYISPSISLAGNDLPSILTEQVLVPTFS